MHETYGSVVFVLRRLLSVDADRLILFFYIVGSEVWNGIVILR
jgi:hypothetical protein